MPNRKFDPWLLVLIAFEAWFAALQQKPKPIHEPEVIAAKQRKASQCQT